MPCSIVWFRNDLRLADNPALIAGLGSGRAVVPLYVLDEETEGARPPGAASRWWLHHSLNALDASLRALGSRLIVRRGSTERVVAEFAAEIDAHAVYWNRVYDQGSRERDARLKQAFVARGVSADSLKADLLFGAVGSEDAGRRPFKVFTPFWRACRGLRRPSGRCLRPATCRRPMRGRRAIRSPRCGCLPGAPDWSCGLGATWAPGEAAAHQQRPTRNQ